MGLFKRVPDRGTEEALRNATHTRSLRDTNLGAFQYLLQASQSQQKVK